MKIPEMTLSIQTALLSWYKKNARKLPWRDTKDPYKIWISEIMLQQTQVDTVIPYYYKFIRRFPNIKKLASANSTEVLKFWAGLGYYRRARMLHGTAKVIIKNFDGKIPSEVAELIKLPGIGRYTAGAISSIAFERRSPILDGNVIRILTRIFSISQDVDLTNTKKQLWELSEKLIPESSAGDFNQSMMELGATICTPDSPRCLSCPVSNLCYAHKESKETFYPVQKKKIKIEKLRRTAIVIRKDDKVLLRQQPKNAAWGGLWTFPTWDKKAEALKNLSIQSSSLEKISTIRHSYTKFQISLDVYTYNKNLPGLSLGIKDRWVTIKNLKSFAFPSPYKKIMEVVQAHAA